VISNQWRTRDAPDDSSLNFPKAESGLSFPAPCGILPATMIHAAKLPLQFDAEGLKADLAGIGHDEWIAHFNKPCFEGNWSGVALRAAEGARKGIFPNLAARVHADTEIVARCPHLREVIAAFQCPLKSVRLLRLTAGSGIREHRDDGLGFEGGEVRIHVPVVTNPRVEFFLDGRRVVMNEGECWYLDLSLPHRVENRGTTDRIHLVIDCTLNDWLRKMILEAGEAPILEGALSGFERFRQMVFDDPALQTELRQTQDATDFTALALRLGGAHGCDFTAGDVDAALQAARRAQLMRWI
jgi:mannose-6-phosphate isomerase-like protein (cupin superfamily)